MRLEHKVITMQIDFTEITTMQDPCFNVLKGDPYQFLLSLTGPTIIDVCGRNTEQTHVIITLINGDEPTGLLAIHRWLTERDLTEKPATNIRIIICSVEAALCSPMLRMAHVYDAIPLTQCFGVEFNHGFFKRAKTIEHAIRSVNPCSVTSLHNTQGFSPAFACASSLNNQAVSIAQSFVETIILSDQMPDRLLTLSFDCPNVAIYLGCSEDPQSSEVAYNGIINLVNSEIVYAANSSANVLLYPKKLVLAPGSHLSFNDTDMGNEGLTLREDIEQFNFRIVKAGQHLGWLDENGLSNITLIDHLNNVCTEQYFSTRFNQFITATNLIIFMASSSKQTSLSQDFLFYVIQN